MSFHKYYHALIKKFDNRYVSIHPKSDQAIAFPEGFGIYVIWLNNAYFMNMTFDGDGKLDYMMACYEPVAEGSLEGRAEHGLIYVGKAGTYCLSPRGNLGVFGNFNELSDIALPIRFANDPNDEADIRNNLRIAPRSKNKDEQFENRFSKKAYHNSFDQSTLIIDFFLFTGNLKNDFRYSPASLQTEILTRYAFSALTLPPGNLEF
jgi:hypothetical protein